MDGWLERALPPSAASTDNVNNNVNNNISNNDSDNGKSNIRRSRLRPSVLMMMVLMTTMRQATDIGRPSLFNTSMIRPTSKANSAPQQMC